ESGPRAGRAATGQAPSGASPGSGDAPATQPSPSATPGDERVDASEPDDTHPLDTPEPATTPSPALEETAPTPVPPDASDTAAGGGTAAERARPPVTPHLSVD